MYTVYIYIYFAVNAAFACMGFGPTRICGEIHECIAWLEFGFVWPHTALLAYSVQHSW